MKASIRVDVGELLTGGNDLRAGECELLIKSHLNCPGQRNSGWFAPYPGQKERSSAKFCVNLRDWHGSNLNVGNASGGFATRALTCGQHEHRLRRW